MPEWMATTVIRAVAVSTPLLWAALGEIYAERSGVVNLGVEGMMILGAFVAFAVAQTVGNPVLGLTAAAAVGGLAALLHAFVTVTLRANQYVSGLALAMFGLGLAGVLGRGYEGIPLLNTLPEISGLTYLGFLLAVVLWFVLYHTRLGIVIRSVGESPAASDALGVNVSLVRYLTVLFGGTVAGVAGGYLSVAYRPSWTEGMTGGMGWIAIAIAIFAGWDPLRAVWGAVLFGALYYLSFFLQTWVAPEVLRMLPFASTILVLAATARRRRGQGAPEALGLPYAGGER
ncbi:MAG: ABC transporter permease [Armatimonadota bacterium]|nr:ABC transporter permease [Armatimonadota bacterium]MDR7519834.1 ABC transporter permease [Armatimonadota bacterium]MDR7550871.1 ABC transporter permease [Armatimonadota bacterium]